MLNQFLVNAVIAAGIYCLVAVSFGLIYSTVRFFHFAHGVVYATGVYFAYSVLRIAFSESNSLVMLILAQVTQL